MKKLLIATIVITWIVIYLSTFCFALEWYNFKTAQFETIGGEISDYSDCSPYIPQDTASQGLYQIYIEMGDTPLESAIKVLKEWTKIAP